MNTTTTITTTMKNVRDDGDRFVFFDGDSRMMIEKCIIELLGAAARIYVRSRSRSRSSS